jgi:hypothetical protein
MGRSIALILLAVSLLAGVAPAVPKAHVITFGKWITVPCIPGTGQSGGASLKLRTLIVDGRAKEYFVGSLHEVTDRLFVVRRAFRINDSLPEDSGVPHWQWQRGGWLLVDRLTGRISPVSLPEFDVSYSIVSWYRDYAAYCGVSDDSRKVFAVVAELSRRKPMLKKMLGDLPAAGVDDAVADAACPAPTWQRAPVRVAFEPAAQEKQSFSIRGHVVDFVTDSDEDEEEAK